MKTNSKRRGFTLMEVLIAMGIAGVGLCGIMTALPVIAFQVQKIRSQVSGDQLAQLARETVELQRWANPANTNFDWVVQDGVNPALFKVLITFFGPPVLVDPWSTSVPFIPPPPLAFRRFPNTQSVGDVDGDTTPDTPNDQFLFFRHFFTDPTSLKVSAHPSSERPELTYVSLNNSIAPDRNDDYSWFYTVLPKVSGSASALPIPNANYYNITDIESYDVSIIVSRGRAFDDSLAGNSGSHRVYEIADTVSGSRADTVYLNVDNAALGKYVAVFIPVNCTANSSSDWYGSWFRWYKVLMARATTFNGSPATRVLLQPVTGGDDLPPLPPPTAAGSFLITADSIIEVQSFSVQ